MNPEKDQKDFPENPVNLAERLQWLAKSSKLADIANWANLPFNTISNYINTGRLPAAEILLTISETKGVNIQWLLTGYGEAYLEDQLHTNTTTASRQTAVPQALHARVTSSGETIIRIPAFEIIITHKAGDAIPDTVQVALPVVAAADSTVSIKK